MGTRKSRHNKGRKVRDNHYTWVHLTCRECFVPFTVDVKSLHVAHVTSEEHRCPECTVSMGPLKPRRFHGRLKARAPAERERVIETTIQTVVNQPTLATTKRLEDHIVTMDESMARRRPERPKTVLDVGQMSESRVKLYTTWRRLSGRAGQKWYVTNICERWRDSFDAFADDMGTRPSNRHQLRRLEEAKPYSPDNCAWFTADDERKARLKVVPLSKLQEDIVKPGIEKLLVPLLLYKGNTSPGRVHRLWNFAIAMMHTECDSLGDGVAISQNPDFSHLCGPLTKAHNMSLRGFFSRLRLNPQVTDNIPGLTEYAAHVLPTPFNLRPVPIVAERRRHAAWREFANKRGNARLKRKERARWELPTGGPGNVKGHSLRSADLFYPYVMYDAGKPMDRLVAIVHACVPAGLPGEFRADICQDLIVELLAGDITEDALIGNPRKYVQPKLKHYRFDQHNQSMDTELIDILQHDEAKRQFDEYVEDQLSDVFRVTRDEYAIVE